MKPVTQKEERIMLAILALKDQAYLIAIQDYLSRIMQKSQSLTSVHLPLSRLEEAGLIIGELGEATAVRGGRRKKIYTLTPQGEAALAELKRVNEALWNGATQAIG